jgi:hypothetical protein
MKLTALDVSKLDELISYLPVDYEKTAKETKAFLRARKIKSPADLMHLVFLYCGADQALREVAGSFTLLDESISDTAVHNRLRACGEWLKMILEEMWFAGVTKLPGNLRLILIDGSSLSVPGADGTSYRLHLAIDLVKLNILHIELTDKHVGEGLMHYPLREGDIVVVDRGYNLPNQIIEISDKGTLITLRLNPNSMRLYSVGGKQKINVFDALSQAQTDQVCLEVWITSKSGEFVKAYVHAQHLPEELRPEARRKCRRNSKSNNIKQETLMYAEWTMILTTVPPDVLDTNTVMALYRLRWQVELFIKRLKSILDIDKLRCAEDSKLNKVWIYGKMLLATLLIKRTDEKFGVGGLEPKRQRDVTPWRFWNMIKKEVMSIILAISSWKIENYPQAKKVMTERPRKRQLQSLPSRIKELVERFG